MGQIFALGPFRLDTRSNLLLRGVEPVALGQRAIALLRALIERPGEVVSTDRLIEAAWAGQSMEESNLSVQIAALRRVLSEEPGGDRWIETLPRRGYRFVAAVTTASDPAAEADPGPQLPDKPSLAVLPFQNLSGDLEQEYFADGIVEDIITELSRYRALFVIARSSTFTYKGKGVDVRQVSRELGVRYVLEGSVRKDGNNVRVTTQLIDAISGAHLWSERYDRALTDIFATQDEITASVASVIEPALAQAEQQRVLRKPPDRLDAWEAYQRGLWHFYKYGPEDNQTAGAFFRQAIALDPNFAPGHYGHALARFWDFWLYSTRSLTEFGETGLAEARLAASLDSKDDMAHAVLAKMTTAVGEWEEGIAEARVAVALNPNSAFAISILGFALGLAGYHEEGIDRLRQAMRASPHDPLTWLWLNGIGDYQFCSRDFDAALKTYRQVIRLRPQFYPAHLWFAAALAYLGQSHEARDALERARAQFTEQIERRRHRPPWQRPQDWAMKTEGLRLAAGEAE